MMEHWAEALPWELRQSPESCTNAQAPAGMTWISTPSSLSGTRETTVNRQGGRARAAITGRCRTYLDTVLPNCKAFTTS